MSKKVSKSKRRPSLKKVKIINLNKKAKKSNFPKKSSVAKRKAKAIRPIVKAKAKKTAQKKNILNTAPSYKKVAKSNSKISQAAQRIVQKVLTRTSKIEKEDKMLAKKLEAVLANQKVMLQNEKQELAAQKEMLKDEKTVLKNNSIELKNDKEIQALEKKQLEELKKLEALEKEIEKHIEPHPLLKVGVRDIVKGSIGALAGVVLHYTFVYGVKITEQLSMVRATLLFMLCFLIGFVFLYATGFRKVQDKKILYFMPIRLVILYLVSLAMSIIVLWFYYPTFGVHFSDSYTQVASVMLPALIGACTADLIGRD
jgi:uncharacterized membrane protein